MELPETNIRHRRPRRRITEIVKDFDTFNKVVDTVKEEPSVGNGMITIICALTIVILSLFELYNYMYNDQVVYRFSVDTDYDERPKLEIDIIINTPCNSLSVSTVSRLTPKDSDDSEIGLSKEPTRFDMDETEEQLWTALKDAHRNSMKPGSPFTSLSEINYVSRKVETQLHNIAQDKVRAEIEDIKKQRIQDRENGIQRAGKAMMMFSMGGNGVFHLIAPAGPDEGRACRLSGEIPVLKGDDDKILISPGALSFPGMIVRANSKFNLSHRIESFNFGPKVYGLVTPLAGTEKMSPSGAAMYKYFIKVVPTRIFGLFGTPEVTYQYSVTAMTREPSQSGHVHSGITFDYDFTANVIDIYPRQTSPIQLLVRLCSIVGGVFATSIVVQHIFSFVVSILPL